MTGYNDKQHHYYNNRDSAELRSVDEATLSSPHTYYAQARGISDFSTHKEDYERGLSPVSHLTTSRLAHGGQKHVHYQPDFEDPNLGDDDFVEDDSPYPEVRAAVANTDDFDMPTNTIRVWVIGLVLAVVQAGINQFFFFRYPGVMVAQLVAQLISYPFGRLAAWALPRVNIFGVPLNPGPFTIKEHVLITIMAGVGAITAYATDVIAVQRVYYQQNWNFGYQWMVVMSTQLIGFSLGGVLRRFIVDPPSMIWPANLVFCALFNTMHSQTYSGQGYRGGISREKFFVLVFIASFLWYFVPGYLFQALSYFSFVCWMAPNNVKVNQMFGYFSGLGMSMLTFDWAQISFIGSPLATPWWAEANIAVAFVFFFWIITPIFYYANVWFGAYLPLLARATFDNTGQPYDVMRILTPDMTFNQTAYEHYSPLYLSTTFALSYGLSFAAVTATIVHTMLFYRRQIWAQARRSLHEQQDIHARLMSRYPRVPSWWYSVLFVIMFVFGVAATTAFPTGMPIWAFILALAIAFICVIPVGITQAITNQQVGLNVVTELIVGYVLPGRPVAMMLFKTWGYITMGQALMFASDFKLGHYMKIAPRAMFMAQVVATMVSGTTQLIVQAWMFDNVPDICVGNEVFICPTTQVFGAASIIWGVIGPERQFSKGQMYYGLSFFFLIGAIAPIIPWIMMRRYPKSWWKYVNFPVVFNGTGLIPPGTAVNYVPWFTVGWFFQWFLRRRHFSWWAKYNYVLSAALDSGVAISAIVIFFALQFPKQGTIGATTIQTWWGNTVFTKTADFQGVPLKPMPEVGFFGPSTW